MLRRSTHRLILLASFASVTTACSVGGSRPSIAPISPALGPSAAPAATRSVTLSITVPAAGAPVYAPRSARRSTDALRHPSYVSRGTSQVAIYINNGTMPEATVPLPPANGSPATYNVTVNAPLGSDTFRVDLLDAASLVLSTGNTTQDVRLSNNVTVTALGVPASVLFNIPDTLRRPPSGTSATIPLNMQVLDADGYSISGVYANYVNVVAVPPGSLGYNPSSAIVSQASDTAAETLLYNGSPNVGRVFATINRSTDPADAVAAAVIRPDALAVGTNVLVAINGGQNGSTLSLVNTSTNVITPVTSGFSTQPTAAMAASPDGKKVYIGFTQGGISVYDSASKAVSGFINTPGIAALTFDDDPIGNTAYALEQSNGAFVVQRILSSIDTLGASATLPSAAAGCTSIAIASNSGDSSVLVSCTNATYSVSFPSGTVNSVSPSTGGFAVADQLSPNRIYAASPMSYVGVFQGPPSNTFDPIANTSISVNGATGAAGLELDPSQRFLYVGAFNSISTVRLLKTGPENVIRTVAVTNGVVTRLRDFPGDATRSPDSSVYAVVAGNSLQVYDTATNTITQALPIAGIVDAVFVP